MPHARAVAAAELDKLAALCGSLRLFGGDGDVAGQLLEPIASALGADAAAYRQLRLHHARPQIVNLTSIGVSTSVADDYLDHFHKFDPFLDRLRTGPENKPALPDAGNSGLTHSAEIFPVLHDSQPAHPGNSFYRYYHDFLYPNGLVRHTGFMICDFPCRQAWVFNFHRPASAPDFSEMELARSRLIRTCLQGQAGSPVTPENGPSSPQAGSLSVLTARERDVVTAVAQGLSNKQIAARLAISPRTVENHLRNIYEKLHVNTRTQLLSVFHRKDYNPDSPAIE